MSVGHWWSGKLANNTNRGRIQCLCIHHCGRVLKRSDQHVPLPVREFSILPQKAACSSSGALHLVSGVDGQRAGSTLLRRLPGVTDVPSDLQVLMLYTSFFRPFGPWFLCSYARDAPAAGVSPTVVGFRLGPAGSAAPLLGSTAECIAHCRASATLAAIPTGAAGRDPGLSGWLVGLLACWLVGTMTG